jgi:hypothetical protein
LLLLEAVEMLRNGKEYSVEIVKSSYLRLEVQAESIWAMDVWRRWRQDYKPPDETERSVAYVRSTKYVVGEKSQARLPRQDVCTEYYCTVLTYCTVPLTDCICWRQNKAFTVLNRHFRHRIPRTLNNQLIKLNSHSTEKTRPSRGRSEEWSKE